MNTTYYNYVETEPKIQPLKSITIQKSPQIKDKILSQNSFESDQSVDNSNCDRQELFECHSALTTKNSISFKKKCISRPNKKNCGLQKLASIRRIKSFQLDDESNSSDEEDSVPKNLMNVNFQFKQEALLCIQKIKELQNK